MLEQMIEGYEHAFAEAGEGTSEKSDRTEAVKVAMRSALRRKWRHLARKRIDDEEPTIPLGARFWPQDLKFEIEHVDAAEATKVARFLAMIVGKAHARQMGKRQPGIGRVWWN